MYPPQAVVDRQRVEISCGKIVRERDQLQSVVGREQHHAVVELEDRLGGLEGPLTHCLDAVALGQLRRDLVKRPEDALAVPISRSGRDRLESRL